MTERARVKDSTSTRIASDDLDAILAESVLGWKVAPDRFIMSDRGWKPRWRFQPTRSVEDAYCLLAEAKPEEFTVSGCNAGEFRVRVRLRNGGLGESHDRSPALAITWAVARAFGIKV